MTIREELKPMSDKQLLMLMNDIRLIQSLRKGSRESIIFWRTLHQKIQRELEKRSELVDEEL